MEPTNQTILATIERAVLHPDVVQRTMRQALGHLNAPADTAVPRQTALQAEVAVIDQELTSNRRGLADEGVVPDGAGVAATREQRRRTRPGGVGRPSGHDRRIERGPGGIECPLSPPARGRGAIRLAATGSCGSLERVEVVPDELVGIQFKKLLAGSGAPSRPGETLDVGATTFSPERQASRRGRRTRDGGRLCKEVPQHRDEPRGFEPFRVDLSLERRRSRTDGEIRRIVADWCDHSSEIVEGP